MILPSRYSVLLFVLLEISFWPLVAHKASLCASSPASVIAPAKARNCARISSRVVRRIVDEPKISCFCSLEPMLPRTEMSTIVVMYKTWKHLQVHKSLQYIREAQESTIKVQLTEVHWSLGQLGLTPTRLGRTSGLGLALGTAVPRWATLARAEEANVPKHRTVFTSLQTYECSQLGNEISMFNQSSINV